MSALKSVGNFILKNQWQAGLVALACSIPAVFGVPFIAWLGMMVVGLVSLCRGFSQGFIILIWSAIPAIVFAFMGRPELLYEQVLAGGLVLLILSTLLRSFQRWDIVIEVAVWVGLVVVLLLHAFVPDIYQYWQTYLMDMFHQFEKIQGVKVEISKQALFYMTHMATGFSVAVVVINGLFNLLVARGWQAHMFNPGGLKREFYHIHLSRTLLIALVICAVLIAFKVDLIWDLMPILLLAFFCGGLSVLHWKMAQAKWMWGMIILYYILLIFWFAVIATVTIVVGVIDSLIDIRKRVNKQT